MGGHEVWAELALTSAAEAVRQAAAEAMSLGVAEAAAADVVLHPHGRRNRTDAVSLLGVDRRPALAALERLAQASVAMSETVRAVDAAGLRSPMLIESRRRSRELLAGRLAETLR